MGDGSWGVSPGHRLTWEQEGKHTATASCPACPGIAGDALVPSAVPQIPSSPSSPQPVKDPESVPTQISLAEETVGTFPAEQQCQEKSCWKH